MSAYQYYEFQALDRRLTAAEMAELRTLSSRAVVTATSAAFVYHYGDFRGDPAAVLAKYFDVLLYIANWGTRRLMFRLPPTLVSSAALRPYCVSNAITLETRAGRLILDMQINKEDGEWIDSGEGLLTGLIPLRAAILAGDYRALYLAWLRVCELELVMEDEDAAEDAADEDDEDEEMYDGDFLPPSTPEPPVPPNLTHLDGALQNFITFFEVDPLWLEVAAAASASLRAADEPLEQWIGALPVEDCRRLLLRAARGEPNMALILRQELRACFGAAAQPAAASARRTAGQLAALVQQRQQRAADAQRHQAAQVRTLRLAALAQREGAAWEQVRAAIEQRTAQGYDQAVSQLRELHELAESRGESVAFQGRLAEIVTQFRRLPSFQARLVAAGLIAG